MLNLLNIAVRATTSLTSANRAPLLALAWVLSNLTLSWFALWIGHPNLGALTVGALDGAIFASIVLVKESARLEAAMTGLLSGFGLDSITNSGRTIATFVHGVHDGLEAIVNASVGPHCDHHEALETMILRATWMAIVVMLLALFVKWGQSGAATRTATPMPTAVPGPVEIARSQAA